MTQIDERHRAGKTVRVSLGVSSPARRRDTLRGFRQQLDVLGGSGRELQVPRQVPRGLPPRHHPRLFSRERKSLHVSEGEERKGSAVVELRLQT